MEMEITMRYLILIFMIALALTTFGCTSAGDRGEEENNSTDVVCDSSNDFLSGLFSEENWGNLEQLFEKIEDDLVGFIDYLRKYGLFESIERVRIKFPESEERARRYPMQGHGWTNLVVYNGEIVLASSSFGVTSYFTDYPEHFNVISEFCEWGLFEEIDIVNDSSGVWIRFWISSEHPYAMHILAIHNCFLYVEKGDVETILMRRGRKIRDEWYIEISPPPGF